MIQRLLALAALAVLGLTGCGDRTVTSRPTSAADEPRATTLPTGAAPAAGHKAAPAKTAAPDSLDDIDSILNEVQADLDTADHEATTPEGDPTS